MSKPNVPLILCILGLLLACVVFVSVLRGQDVDMSPSKGVTTQSLVIAEKNHVTYKMLLKAGGEAIVTIHPNGVVEFGKGYTPDTAAKVFWDAVGREVKCKP